MTYWDAFAAKNIEKDQFWIIVLFTKFNLSIWENLLILIPLF